MKTKLLALASAWISLQHGSMAQTWQLLPYTYANYTQATEKIFASAGDTLIAAVNHEPAPSSVSTDGGMTWMPLFPDKPIVTAEFGPNGNMYVVTTKKYLTTQLYNLDTLFRSSNGSTWTNMGKIPWSGNTHDEGDFTISANNTLLFPYQVGMGSPKLSASVNDGASWTNAGYSGDIYSIAASYSRDTIVIGTYNSGVQYSHDAGATFSAASGGNWGFSTVGGAEIAANGDVYVATGGQVHKSTDGGQTFTGLTPNPWIAMNIAEFAYAPANNKFYFYGVWGIFESADCISWTNISTSLTSSPNIYDIAISDNYIYAIVDTLLYRTALSSPSGVQDQGNAGSLTVYPNPASECLYVSGDLNGTYRIRLSSLRGEEVADATATLNKQQAYQLDISGLAPGMYFVHVQDQDGKASMKKIIVK